MVQSPPVPPEREGSPGPTALRLHCSTLWSLHPRSVTRKPVCESGGPATRKRRADASNGPPASSTWHIFPADHSTYPTETVAKRASRLRTIDRARCASPESLRPVPAMLLSLRTRSFISRVDPAPKTGLRVGAMEFASLEIFDAGISEAQAWVLVDNQAARAFYRSHGWRDTAARRDCKCPPRPQELKMMRQNPSAPRRSR